MFTTQDTLETTTEMKEQVTEVKNVEIENEKNVNDEVKHPGLIFTFILLMFMATMGECSEQLLNAGYDMDDATGKAVLSAIVSTGISAVVMMCVPFICRMVQKGKLPYKKGNLICVLNSIVLFVGPPMIGYPLVGGLGVLFFYFINKWIFVE